ncbi:DUF1740-domain-containing protein [Xylariaceae sp. FL1272]|nr:DUF1740-domain-containing protein [Xylariaceae sp. FL1272]
MPSFERKTKSVVPCFSSFKKPTSPSQESSKSNAVHPHSTSSHPSPSFSHARNSSSQPRSSAPQSSSSSLYVVDKRGDALVRRYGTNDRNEIPSYRRIGNGRVLGVDGFMRIERSGNHDQFSMRDHHETRSILSSNKKALLAKGISTASRPVYIRPKTSENQVPPEDYLSLNTSRKRKRGDEAFIDEDDEQISYRDIHGKSKTHEYSESDEQSQSDYSGDEATARTDPLTIRSIELSRKTREKPKDIHSWIELVNHRWDTKTALKQFSEVMQKYPDDLELWTLHMTFHQTTPSLFTFSGIKQRYVDKLTSLRAKMHTADYAIQAIHVFLRLTIFLSDAGFADLASAAWSATLDMNFARPPHASPDTFNRPLGPSAMQEFWEAEVPRMGEDQWQGCAAFSKDPNTQQPPDPKPSTTDLANMPETRDGYRAWYFVEQHRASNATLPARTLDDGAEDDPFRVVMYTDIQDFLLDLPSNTLAHAQDQLINAFLIFCGLPPAIGQKARAETGMRAVVLDPLIARCDQMDLVLDANHIDGQNTEDCQRKVPVFPPIMHQVQPSPEVVYSSQKWQCYLGEMRSKIPVDRYRWISTVLKQLTCAGTFRDLQALRSLLLAFEMMNEPENVKKSAKSLLKQDPGIIDLYLGYATAESERGHQTAAENALAAARTLPQFDLMDRMRLGVSGAWLKLTSGNLNGAILELCRLTDESQSRSEDLLVSDSTEATSSQILKARRFLAQPRDKAQWPGAFCDQLIFDEAFVLFEYLTGRSENEPKSAKQGDISSAIAKINDHYDFCVQFPESRGSVDEEFFQFAARLLYYHATHGSCRPSLFREQITKYLNLFPSNSIFLALFAWSEERLSVNDRVRSLLHSHILSRPHETLSSHIFAINYEIQTGNMHSTRAAFERAVVSDACAHHPGLWVAYIRFCHDRKELRKKAKGVFARAIQACPWCKDVYMEAFGTLCRDMDSAELKGVYNTMYDKGLRIFVDLHEFVDEWRRDHGNREKDKGKGKAKEERRPLVGT